MLLYLSCAPSVLVGTMPKGRYGLQTQAACVIVISAACRHMFATMQSHSRDNLAPAPTAAHPLKAKNFMYTISSASRFPLLSIVSCRSHSAASQQTSDALNVTVLCHMELTRWLQEHMTKTVLNRIRISISP